MSVVIDEDHHLHLQAGPDARCNMCEGRLHAPYVFWIGSPSIHICRHCCEGNGKGLMADIAHVRAVAELHHLGYSSQTYERVSIDKKKDVVVEIGAVPKRRGGHDPHRDPR